MCLCVSCLISAQQSVDSLNLKYISLFGTAVRIKEDQIIRHCYCALVIGGDVISLVFTFS